jgi:hypothetical protein
MHPAQIMGKPLHVVNWGDVGSTYGRSTDGHDDTLCPPTRNWVRRGSAQLNVTKFSVFLPETQAAPHALADAGATMGTYVMPKYFFNVYNDRTLIDDIGEELPDKHSAWKEATVTTGQMLQHMDGRFEPGSEWRLEVTDEFANPVYVVRIIAEVPS